MKPAFLMKKNFISKHISLIIFIIPISLIGIFLLFPKITIQAQTTDTIPPTTPTNLTATVISSSQINLSWTASTDNSGTVAGYNIYRCEGINCTPTTLIDTSSTNSYSDTGLTQSTTYVYAVSSYDEAGNSSSNSSTVSGTTEATSSNVYYVSPTGSASWSECTNIDTPCDIYTASDNAQAGDTVFLRGGTYEIDWGRAERIWGNDAWQHSAVEIANSGTGTSPIIFKSYLSEIPLFIWDSDTVIQDPNKGSSMFGSYRESWIIWDGLNVIGRQDEIARDKIFNIWFGKHITIRNCDLQGSSVTNPYNNPIIFSDGDSTDPTDYFLIINNKIHGATSVSGDNSAGIMFYDSDHVTITKNNFYDNQNGIYDKSGSNNVECSYNTFYNNQLGYLFMATASDRINISIHNNIFINNSVYDVSISRIGDTDPSVIVANFFIFSNTFYSQFPIYSITARWRNQPNSMINTQIYNNLFSNGDPIINIGSDLTDYMDYNNYDDVKSYRIDGVDYFNFSSYKSATNYDLNSTTNNPNFINPGGTSPEDYKRTSYPTDGRGGTYPNVMGAYITGNEIIGYTDGGVSPTLDTTPPTLSSPSPSGTLTAGTTQTTLSITTNENSTCKYSTTPETDYSSIPNTFTTTGGTTHSTTVTGLTDGNTYNYYIRCQDESGNVNTNDTTITFSISPTSSRADVDNNSQINTTDAMLTLRNSLGLSMTNTNWQASTTTGDVNCDGNSNSTDAMLILRYSLGLSMEGTGWCVE